jgi:hypothetical protein
VSASSSTPASGQSTSDRTRDVIRAFVAQYRYLHEWRIQKLVFYADLMSLSRRGYRLTSVNFRRHHYGVYSDQVHDALREMTDLETHEDSTPTGRPTVRYSVAGSLGAPTLNREDFALIQEAHEATRELTNEQLADWGKETSLWRSTAQGDVMDFNRYAREIGRDTPAAIARYEQIRSRAKTRRARFGTVTALRADMDAERGSTR